jgi:membrane-bound metal-dependent hydrolase YbcI (DUF457 family)
MPTPVGHALAGLAAGWAVARPADGTRRQLGQAALFGLVGAAPDLDLLFGRHRYETHSIGAAILAGLCVAAIGAPVARSRALIFWSTAAAWASHPLLDMLAPDNWPPIGVMAFWPFSRDFYISGLNLFLPVSRDVRSMAALEYDAWAAAREALILVPVVALVWWFRTRTSRNPARSSDRDGRRPPSA